MIDQISYRLMRPGEERSVCRLVSEVFDACIAGTFDPEGVAEFLDFAQPGAMTTRMQSGGFVFVASLADAPVGMLEFMPPHHVAMMFVRHRGRGIGKALLARTIGHLRTVCPKLSKLTVHASRNAEPIYQRMGFHPVGGVTRDHGIIYIPMERPLLNKAP